MINVTLHNEQKKVEAKPFPKVMRLKLDGSLVFFVRPEYGLPLLDTAKFADSWDLTTIKADCWVMKDFEDFNEGLLIQNA